MVKRMYPQRNRLQELQQGLHAHYDLYREGRISEAEYLSRIKPIDSEIDRIELSYIKCLKEVKK